VLHRYADLTPNVVERVRGIPVTNRVRTLTDLGAVVPEQIVAKVMEEWLADRHVDVEALRRGIEVHYRPGRRGAGVARRVLENRALGLTPGDSTDEHLLALILRTYGVPLPTYHHLITLSSGEIVEVDYA